MVSLRGIFMCVEENSNTSGQRTTLETFSRLYMTTLWRLNVEVLESVARLCYVGVFLESELISGGRRWMVIVELL